MKTINAKQLRANLEQTFDDVSNGQDVIVTYRTKAPIRITRATPVGTNAKKLAGLAVFDAAPKKQPKYDVGTDIKELYSQSLQNKYGQK